MQKLVKKHVFRCSDKNGHFCRFFRLFTRSIPIKRVLKNFHARLAISFFRLKRTQGGVWRVPEGPKWSKMGVQTCHRFLPKKHRFFDFFTILGSFFSFKPNKTQKCQKMVIFCTFCKKSLSTMDQPRHNSYCLVTRHPPLRRVLAPENLFGGPFRV